MIPLAGWLPDGDPFAPGTMTDVNDLVPTRSGYKTAPSAQSMGITALAAAAKGAAAVRKLDDTVRLFAGTATALYEWSGSSWTDRTRVGAYTLGTDNGWQFSQFGDVTIAAAKSDTLQASTAGAFADISGAPKAAHMDQVAGFVMLGNYDDGTDTPDGWFCSAQYDHTDWTPAVATQCANGRLLDTPGPITAIKSIQNAIVAYKGTSLYLGQYVGPPLIWSWQLVSRDAGAPSAGAVASRKTEHYFISNDDFYMFDGSRPQRIPNAPKKWFFGTQLEEVYRNRIKSLIDAENGLVYWFYPSRTSGGSLDAFVTYNYETGQWGKGTIDIQVPVIWQTATQTIDGLDTLSATIDGLPDISFDSPFWSSSSKIGAIIDTTNTVKSFDGVSSGGNLTTGDIGSDGNYSLLRRVRPRFITKPTTLTMTNYFRDELDDDLTEDSTVTAVDNNCDVLRSSRWHRVKLTMTGDAELNAMHIDIKGEGER